MSHVRGAIGGSHYFRRVIVLFFGVETFITNRFYKILIREAVKIKNGKTWRGGLTKYELRVPLIKGLNVY